ncbi:MAG: hypothetical protein ACWA5U_01020 [bacterium]
MAILFNTLLPQKTVAAETNTSSVSTEDSDKESDTKDSEENTETPNENGVTVGEIAEANIENSLANIEVIQQTLETLRSEIENSKESTTLNSNNVGTIKEGLKLIEEKLQEAYNNLDESRSSISSNKAMLEEVHTTVLELSRNIRTNSSDVNAQKSLIEDNSVRLYEVLVQLSGIEEKFKSISNLLNQQKNEEKESNIILATYDDLHYIWLLFSTVIILSLPLAFTLTHTKIALADHIPQTQGVILIYIGAIIGYFTIGFGLMYGITSSGWLGTSNFLPFDDFSQSPSSDQAGITYLFPIIPFFLYKLGFILLAVLIIYQIIGRQLSSMTHLLLALFVSTLLIPVYSHWIWADQLIESNKGWLAQASFIDQAGAITINSIAAWFAFIIAWKIGSTLPPPEIGQAVDDDEKISYSASTVLLLWLNWISLTTGTTPLENHFISNVMINVSLAAAGGAFIAFLHYGFFNAGMERINHTLGGTVAGLVAIAACVEIVTFLEALVIGSLAGLFYNLSYAFIRKYFLKKTWQIRSAHLVAIHGTSGVWGALAVVVFGSEGNFDMPNVVQLTPQLQGIVVAFIYSFVLAQVALTFIKLSHKKKVKATT